ncbi:hypothetical protein OAE26_01885 [Synechococcus sp. AH-551-E05]|nr:hypothetical protein [Synechococcus sp. AH-551-E05]MDB4651312.1 hypothetical protein [Synechococcus sp. AH-551-E05]
MKIQLPTDYDSLVTITQVKESEDGTINVEVQLKEGITPSERGTLLLDLEDEMVKNNSNVRLWHAPIGDKNTLRKLRGIKLQ